MILQIMNISSRIFPSELKLAKVVPIFKARDTSAINNYRPISVLSFFSKKIIRIITFSNYLAHTEPLFMSRKFCHWKRYSIIDAVNDV